VIIVIPKETLAKEHRVAVIPDKIKTLIRVSAMANVASSASQASEQARISKAVNLL
jgi:alanine dehydrogenase